MKLLRNRFLILSALFALFLGLTCSDIYAAPNLLLQCLAKEETQLHKEKSQGALYQLNQSFLNELASSNDILIKKNFVDEICQSKKHSPSVGMLRLLMLKESEIYDLSLSEVEGSMRPFKMAYINEFQKQVPRLFIQYISSLQAEMPTANCLTKAIPELNFFNERFKFLEEEVDVHELLKDKKKIEAVFKKLETISKIKSACTKDAQKKERLLRQKVEKKENTSL